MSDFLLIVPEGWVEFEAINALINDNAVPSDLVYSQITQEAWGDLDTTFVNANIPVDGKLVVDAKLISAATGFRCWFMFA
jgi:hypothetical protein